MTVPQKAALSLLISVFLFAIIAVSAFTGLFDLIETRFYNVSLAKSFAQETESDAKLIENFFINIESNFANSLSDSAVRRSFMPNQTDEDIFDRTRIYGTLLETFSGLQSIRFVDHNGSRIHFSTYAPDILNQTRNSVSYRNYNQDPQNLPFERVQASATDSFKLIMDDTGDRIIFSYPFFDSLDVYRGTALFTLSVRAVAEQLISENKLKIGEDVSVTSIPPGIVTGTPGTSKEEILSKVASIWKDGIMTMSSFESSTGKKLALFSSKVGQGFFYGRLVDEQFFSFPQPMRIILLLSILLTIFLAIFLGFNLKQDPLVIVQNRLKNLQISLIEQYYERKSEIDWAHWSRELEQRREEVRHEVKRGIKVTGEKQKTIDQLIDKSWDELLAAIGGNRVPGGMGGLDEEKLQTILNKVLQSMPAAKLPAATGASAPQPSQPAQPIAFTPVTFTADSSSDDDMVEELEEVEELEDLDATEGDGAIDGTLEELEEIAEIESSETAKAFEEADDLEELEEAGSGTEDYSAFGEIAEESEDGSGSSSSSTQTESAEMTIDKVASHIEFELVTNTDGDDIEDILGTELEIFSPFAFMADGELQSKDEEPETAPAPAAKKSRKKATTTGKKTTETEKKNQQQENEQNKKRLTETIQPGTGLLSRSRIYADGIEAAPLVEIHNDSGSPVAYTPFVFEENAEPEVLQSGSVGLLATASTFRDVIIERDGVNFINQDAFTPGEETDGALDIDFKELVDSVMG